MTDIKLKRKVQDYYKAILERNDESTLNQFETELAKNIENLSIGNSFFELPMDNLIKIIRKADFASMEPKNSEKTIQNIIKKTTENHPEQSGLLFNCIHCRDCNFDFNQYIKMLKSFSTSEMCSRIVALYQDLDATSVNYDYEYELNELKKENKLLAKQLAASSKFELIEVFPPVTEQPKDYEPNIYKAIKNGNLASVQYGIEHDVIEGSSAISVENYLHLAVQNGHLNIVQYLIQQKGYDKELKDRNGNTPLHIAAREGRLNIVIYLIEKAYVNRECRNNEKFTPLHFACQRFHYDIITYLISKQHVNIEAATSSEWCPIHFAVVNGSEAFVKFICEQHPNLEAKTNEGYTPLLLAIRFDRLQVVKYLVDDMGVNINAVENNGLTALHVASFYGRLAIIPYLLSKGLDKSTKDYQNRKPYKLACKAAGISKDNFEEIIELLK